MDDFCGHSACSFLQRFLICIFLFPTIQHANSQISTTQIDGSEPYPRDISALFLTIAPDARAAGMGEAGAASEPDVFSQHWNAAKFAFLERKGGNAAGYSPWLINLIYDIHLGYVSGYYRMNDKNVLSSSSRIISLGHINLVDLSGVMYLRYNFEFAGDIAWSRKFSDRFSSGVAIRYIHSDLAPDRSLAQGVDPKVGRSVAGDLGIYYQDQFDLGDRKAHWALGMNISNIGTRISYYPVHHSPIPTNLRAGGRINLEIHENHSLALVTDAHKLLVPTMPVYGSDPVTNETIVLYGNELPGSVLAGMIRSFYDAPGYVMEDGTRSVFREEMHEVIYCGGTEYLYKEQLALRFGYFHEHMTKGAKQFYTAGIGAKFNFLQVDISYLLPVKGDQSPLYNTFRLSLSADL